MNEGEFEGTGLLQPETVRLALEPHTRPVFTGADLLSLTFLYGPHWFVWTERFGGSPWPIGDGSFGHGGAEGTLA